MTEVYLGGRLAELTVQEKVGMKAELKAALSVASKVNLMVV